MGSELPEYRRPIDDKYPERVTHLFCWTCGFHFRASGGCCPECGAATITTEKRGTNPDRRTDTSTGDDDGE